jgi:hypothetical protein
MYPDPTPRPDAGAWTPLERFAFRAAFSYAAIFAVASILDGGAAGRSVSSTVGGPVVTAIGRWLLRLDGSPNDGGVGWAVAQQLTAVLSALAIAGLWSLVDRRTEYRRLHGWTRIVIRYYVAVVMLIYGGFKVINSQFPPPSLDLLGQPLGTLSPMALLWSFMGYSTAYATFAGLGEVTGAFLLFFRQTTTLGALIVLGVMSNVALMNYAYDVPVKQLSVNLVLAAIALIAPDVQRLLYVFVLNRPARPADLSFDLGARWVYRLRRVAKPLVMVVATCVPLAFSWRVHSRFKERSALFGVYEVDRFARNGTVIPPLLTETTRWRRVVFGRPGSMSVRLVTDSLRAFSATVDTTRRQVTLSPRTGPRQQSVFVYEQPSPGTLHMRGVDGGDTVDVALRRLDHERLYPLARGR